MKLEHLARLSRRVADTPARLEKIALLADGLRRLRPEETETGVAMLSGILRQGRIGVGEAALRRAAATPPAAEPDLTLLDADRTFQAISGTEGKGSAAERGRLLEELYGRATAGEQQFLTRLIGRELRQGALEGVLVEAVARAAAVPAGAVRRAVMLSGDLPRVGAAALTRGEAGLDSFSLRLFTPLSPMLAGTAEGVEEALERLERASFEWKLDGARVQVHKDGEDVRVYTRRLHDVTAVAPEIVKAAAKVPARKLILDGEALVLRPGGRPAPFQVTMRRFGRRQEVERMRAELPLEVFFFDCLKLDDDDLIDRPAAERTEALSERVPASHTTPRIVTADPAEADSFLAHTLARGHEGVMAKSLEPPYQAGRRGGGWLKVKPSHTLDLVVLAAEWGSGRRRDTLSNLHLGARDEASGGFVMLGKTFKGLTDEMLAWQTRRLQELEVHRERHTVYVCPELVVEVAFSGIQTSPQYPAGMALRFARVKRHRPDKRAGDADTLTTVRTLHERLL